METIENEKRNYKLLAENNFTEGRHKDIRCLSISNFYASIITMYNILQ